MSWLSSPALYKHIYFDTEERKELYVLCENMLFSVNIYSLLLTIVSALLK